MLLIGFAVSAVFAYLAVRKVRWSDTWSALQTSDYRLLAPVLALLVLAFFIRAIRWQSLFLPEQRPPLGATSRALFLGYLANNLLPVRAGEAVRVIALNRLAGASLTRTAMTVLVERAFDVLSLVVLLFVVSPWLPRLAWFRAAGLLALALVLILAIVGVILHRTGERGVHKVLRPLRRVLPAGALEHAPRDLLSGLAGLLRPRMAIVAFGWTTLSWLVLGAAYWLEMEAFHLGTPPLSGLLVVIAIGLAMILPSTPAALGIFEGATVVALGVYGIGDSEALAYALVLHAMSFLPFVVLAPVVLGGTALSWRRVGAQEAERAQLLPERSPRRT
jgi:glycosyltransferase 2 family protein